MCGALIYMFEAYFSHNTPNILSLRVVQLYDPSSAVCYLVRHEILPTSQGPCGSPITHVQEGHTIQDYIYNFTLLKQDIN